MPIKRLLGMSMALLMLLGLVLCRVFTVSTDSAYAASAGEQVWRRVTLPPARGDFYDRAGRPLTGVTPRWYALCIPGDGSYAALFPYVSYAEQARLYARRNSATPFLIEVGRDLSAGGVYCCRGAQRWLPVPIARHLLGYLDGDGHGVAGLELAYDDVLTAAGGSAAVLCATNARGALLTGEEPHLQSAGGTGQGVRLTLDADIQRLAEGTAQTMMPRGCILILDTATAEVRAAVSMPEFDPDDIAKSIAADDTSLINRALAAFSAGSVFKLVLAAAAYENGLDWYTHNCDGYEEIAGQIFRCAQGHAHGLVNLRGALEASCNCFFINLGRALGPEKLLQTAQKFGFGSAMAVAPGLKSAAGVLPTAEALQNPGQLAMFSFGQGSLTVTPLQIAAMVNALAAGGVLRAPALVQGIVDANGNVVQAAEAPEPVTVCRQNVARVLCSMLCSVVEEGTGGAALPRAGGAGGKTGTAQTGQYDENGSELLNHWFAGFWPAQDPQYTIVVLQDGVLQPEYSSARIFACLANGLLAMAGQPPENAETPQNP